MGGGILYFIPFLAKQSSLAVLFLSESYLILSLASLDLLWVEDLSSVKHQN